MLTPLDPLHLPAIVGVCVHCGLPLYVAQPVAVDVPLAHVACEVNEHRHGQASV